MNASIHTFEHTLTAYTETLAVRLKVAADARRQLNRYLALEFNVFSYIKPDEVRISDLIAELLNPEGKHGQGPAFLKQFVEQLGYGDWLSGRNPTVRREELITYPKNSYGSLDIVIDFGEYGIGIENKVWAGEQRQQLSRYRDHLKHRYSKGFCLIYLTATGKEPKTLSSEDQEQLKTARQFKTLTYRGDLQQWLAACEKECTAEKIRWLLRDFCEFIKSTFEEEP
jgi:hypothetical protein